MLLKSMKIILLLYALDLSVPYKVCSITPSTDGSNDGDWNMGWRSQLSRYYCHWDSWTELEWGTDDHNDPFTNDVEADLDEDEAVIENE